MTLQAPLIKGEDSCKKQLRRMCKDIAENITAGGGPDITRGAKDASSFMEDVYDIEWITHQDKTYKAARLMVAGGGPNIWVNLQRNVVQGYWWGDYCEHHFSDQIGLDEYCEEIYGC